jgi:hypothetical protein
MNNHTIDLAIYLLAALSNVLAIVLMVSLLVQLHAEGSELLSWNSWVEYFASWSG